MAVVCSSILGISMINEALLKGVMNVREEVRSCTSRECLRWKDLMGRVLSQNVGGVSAPPLYSNPGPLLSAVGLQSMCRGAGVVVMYKYLLA